jgi:hypothetical protein
MAPHEARDVLLEQEGTWSVELVDPGNWLHAFWFIMRLFTLDAAWVTEARKQLPMVWTGTKSECRWIEVILAEQKIAVKVIRESDKEPGSNLSEGQQ